MQFAAIMALIEALLAASPKVVELAKELKDFISNLFTKKVITKEEQDALHAYVDAVGLIVKSGNVPKHWQVNPDPVDPPTAIA